MFIPYQRYLSFKEMEREGQMDDFCSLFAACHNRLAKWLVCWGDCSPSRPYGTLKRFHTQGASWDKLLNKGDRAESVAVPKIIGRTLSQPEGSTFPHGLLVNYKALNLFARAAL